MIVLVLLYEYYTVCNINRLLQVKVKLLMYQCRNMQQSSHLQMYVDILAFSLQFPFDVKCWTVLPLCASNNYSNKII